MILLKDVPMPDSRRPAKYNFRDMEVGDCIYFEKTSPTKKEYEAAKKYFQRSGKKMRSRTEGKKLWIWRVE